ncbi:MAG: prenyltransferase [bacterium]|nr:prenyltransferase [bacterium]
MKHLLSISRPSFWFYTAGPFLLGFTAAAPTLSEFYSVRFVLLFLFFLLPANLFLYGINDLFDGDTDQLNQKKGQQEHFLRQPESNQLRLALIGVVLLCIFIAITLRFESAVAMIIFLVLAAAYSAPPFRLKARAFLDSYSNILYLLPALVGWYLFMDSLPPFSVLLAGAAWTAAMHAYSAIPDIQPDKKAGVTTIAVRLGEERTALFCLVNWSFFTLILLTLSVPLGLLAFMYPITIWYQLQQFKEGRSSIFNQWYWRYSAINTVFGMVLFSTLLTQLL